MHATKRSSVVLITALSIACAGGAAAPGAAAGPGRWELLPASDHPLPRHETGYVRVGDRFYLVGGRGTKPVKPVEIFDPETGAWTTGATPPLEIHHFQAVEYDGKVYVVCGMTGGYPHETPLANVYVYDPAADRWTVGPEIPRDRRRGSAGTVVYRGKIYLVAGIQDGHWDGHVPWFDAFDPRTGTWQRLPDAPHARDHFHAAVIDGRLYAAGGRRSSAKIGKVVELTVPEVDVYDFRTGRWSTLPASSNIPTQRAGTFSAVLGGRLLVMGGESAAQQPAHSEVEALDPRTGRWTTLAPLVVGRQATQAVEYGGRLYVVAGSRTRGATEVNSQEMYRPER